MESLYYLFVAAKEGDTRAVGKIAKRFEPLVIKKATEKGYFDEDCYQECMEALIISIDRFVILE
uniref:helix-turn-helix domain-containing protein n=1 Tax=Candidatus Enterococcus willemsii TaxID=1857215 RepID=UPI00403F59B5